MRRKPHSGQLLLFGAPPPEPRGRVCRNCGGPMDFASALESDLCPARDCFLSALRGLRRRLDDCDSLGLPTEPLEARIRHLVCAYAAYRDCDAIQPAAALCAAGKEI